MNQLKYYLPFLLLFQIHQFAIAQDLLETDKIPVQNPKNQIFIKCFWKITENKFSLPNVTSILKP